MERQLEAATKACKGAPLAFRAQQQAQAQLEHVQRTNNPYSHSRLQQQRAQRACRKSCCAWMYDRLVNCGSVMASSVSRNMRFLNSSRLAMPSLDLA